MQPLVCGRMMWSDCACVGGGGGGGEQEARPGGWGVTVACMVSGDRMYGS